MRHLLCRASHANGLPPRGGTATVVGSTVCLVRLFTVTWMSSPGCSPSCPCIQCPSRVPLLLCITGSCTTGPLETASAKGLEAENVFVAAYGDGDVLFVSPLDGVISFVIIQTQLVASDHTCLCIAIMVERILPSHCPQTTCALLLS